MKDFNFEEIIESCPMDYIYGKLTGDDYFDLFVLKSSIKEFNLKLLSEVLGYNIDFKIIFSKNYNFIEEYCKGLNESFSLKLIDNDYVIIWFNRYLFKKYNKLKLGFKKEKEILDLFLDSLKEYITFNHIDRKYVIEKTNKDIFFDDKNNEFKDISGIAENIFYKRAIEYGVNKNDEMFFEIFNYLDDVVIIKEGEKTIYVNNAFEKLYGLNCKDLYRENSMIVKLDRIHPKDRYKFNNIDFKKFFMAEARIIRADNEVRNVLFRANSIKNENGESIRRIIIINDITNNIEKGNEMEKLRMEFFANISHEFKTPVNLIYSALQLLELKLKNNRDRDGDIYINYIKMAKQNVFRLLKLINNLIDSTKLEAGFFNVNIKNHDIVVVLKI
ncbi:sensory box histidine kinase/response regulator [Clostridium perfringens]|uniref:histidine kinase dimerization/phospho-acceptor domain-containing protein n=1 Tax=Clostridium perfringens TaxID=1502 RepID=UPI000D8C8DED|nr:histidine kinase dimerization/phospho-acceptor domain-containing protein [Clostridium perfringens]SQB24105.1 sensory box histidine kinase/response regulator [Clostridium perfringens]STB62023.1 sensory box histidine kinase/response regulator [Clostridium perfringens]